MNHLFAPLLSSKFWLRGALYGTLAIVLISALLTMPLQWINPPTTAFILRDGPERVSLRQSWIAIDDISPAMPLAVVAAEDQKFPDHVGFDIPAIVAALTEDRHRTRGASTITQQLAKNVYLWPARSLFRKGIEAWLTLWIELTWSKQRILEVYLNAVEFGPGIYGVGTASQTFFNKAPAQLNRHEAALLAAVLPNPKRLSARNPSPYVYQRARTIQNAMASLGGSDYLAQVF